MGHQEVADFGQLLVDVVPLLDRIDPCARCVVTGIEFDLGECISGFLDRDACVFVVLAERVP